MISSARHGKMIQVEFKLLTGKDFVRVLFFITECWELVMAKELVFLIRNLSIVPILSC